jgi:hypothetical protein
VRIRPAVACERCARVPIRYWRFSVFAVGTISLISHYSEIIGRLSSRSSASSGHLVSRVKGLRGKAHAKALDQAGNARTG